VHRCSSLSPFLPLPSFVDRFLVCPPPQSWQTGTGFVTISSYCQPKHPLHLPTLVSSGSMGGGGWGLLCRMRTSSQWYEVNRRPAVCLFSQGWYSVFISHSFHLSLPTFTFSTCHYKKKHFNFNHILVLSVTSLLCTWHIINLKNVYNLNQSVVEKFFLFVELGSSCRMPINQHFWWGLVCTSAIGGVSSLHICVRYGRNVPQIGLLKTNQRSSSRVDFQITYFSSISWSD